ncbi:sulfotransferase domain-containing protein [Mameliella sp. CS4]|uniref:sulfotransferase family protein n=1 Tax=Mameliella sp. CS4 TaxID=2862329 RepID=UPI001C5DBF76|nr:sulfotransferase domain-containing protein [Mameliella sp. CS4]MBW4985696.1 sulfotransferase domain-containing protein [Mameliella sp. CS4]
MKNCNIPNLVVIGAMKCGTTTLHDYLSIHPEVFMSDPKEVNWFAGENANRPVEWYRGLFDRDARIRGESSQNYSKRHVPLYSDAPERMASLVPEARLIYIVRDPIERYRSHVAENYIGEDSEWQKWNRENDHHFKTGLYHWQLQPFLVHFPRERIMVVELERLSAQRLVVMNEIFDFLGIDRMDDPTAFDFTSNPNGEDVVPTAVQRHPLYRAARRLAPGLTGRLTRAPAIRKRFFAGSYKPELSLEERTRLQEAYAEDVAALRSLTGQSFSSWSV